MKIVKRKKSKHNGLFVFLMLLPALLFIATFTYYPMFKGIVMAFQSYSLWNLSETRFIGFENFRTLFRFGSDNVFYSTLWNSVKWVFISLFFQLHIGFFLALLLKKKFIGRGIYQGIIFFPWAISGFMIGIIWRWMFNGHSGVINDILIKVGILNQPFGFLSEPGAALYSVIAANVWYGIPFFTIMILAALQGVPEELYEASQMDGASSWQKFLHITLPFIKPVLVLTTLLRGIWILNFPDIIYAMTGGGPAGSSHIITTYMIEKTMSLDYGMASAVGVIIMLILTLYTIVYLMVSRFEELGDF